MMKPIIHKRASPILLLILLVVYACGSLDNQGQNYPNLGANEFSGDYLINPDTILDALKRGDTDVFLPMLATPGPDDDLLPPGSFAWTQADYLNIASALSQYVWKETMEDWSVYYVYLNRDCHNDLGGFDSFVAIYFKVINVNSQNEYTTRQIDIFPLARQVTWGSGSNYPRPFLRDWNSADLSNFKVTADEALQIAEDNGGEDARLRVSNNCNISVSSPHNNDDDWSVSYYFRASFQVIVDPYNGKFKTFNEFQ